ncbi:MAG: hypothetical protein ACRDGH_18150 [Candidatus Limnocylindria bacterium]
MPLFGYIDPGAGSLLIQALIAAIVSVPFLFRSAIRSALQRLRRTPGPVDEKGVARPEAE